MSQFRNFCFTLFDVSKPLNFDQETMKYMVYQTEECPTTKKRHFQGYIEFKNPVRVAAIKKTLGDKIHIEKRKGTAQQASDYCMKPESRIEGPWVFGQISQPGKRTDIEEVAEAIKDGATTHDIAVSHPVTYIKYHKGVDKLMAVLDPPKERQRPCIMLLYGPPGIGKSRWVRANYPNAYFAKDTEQGWFDGYDRHEVIVFDEFRGLFPRYEMLQLIDYQPLRLPVKGGYTTIHATTFIFTSNTEPESWYQYDLAWQRRLQEFTIFRSGGGIVLPATSVTPTSVTPPLDRPEN